MTMRGAVRSLEVRRGVGLTANVVQHTTLRFSDLAVGSPALVILKHGRKEFHSGNRSWTLHGGDAIAIAGGQSFDVTNHLSPQGLFEARWLVWDKTVLQGFETAAPKDTRFLNGASVLRQVGSEFLATVERAIDAVRSPTEVPHAIAAHRLAEVLMWLSLAGVTFSVPRDASISTRLRGLFGASPSAAWAMPAVAARLAMSEATLRRRLSDEGTSFMELLTDVRMSLAMTFLQSTDRAVGEIAADVGYESASRFAIRFRERFGFPPTAIRGHQRQGAASATPRELAPRRRSPAPRPGSRPGRSG